MTADVSTIEDAYDEIVKWQKHIFLVPFGKIGREFIDKFTKHINDWNNRSPLKHVALKTAIVLQQLALKSLVKNQKQRINKNASGNDSINGIEVKSTLFYAKSALFNGT